MAKKIKVTQVRSLSGQTAHQRRIIESLGLGRINKFRVHDDTPAIRGMITKTAHLVEVEPVK